MSKPEESLESEMLASTIKWNETDQCFELDPFPVVVVVKVEEASAQVEGEDRGADRPEDA